MEHVSFLNGQETRPHLFKSSTGDLVGTQELPVLIQQGGERPPPSLGWEHWDGTPGKFHEATCLWDSFSTFRDLRKKPAPLATAPPPAVRVRPTGHGELPPKKRAFLGSVYPGRSAIKGRKPS